MFPSKIFHSNIKLRFLQMTEKFHSLKQRFSNECYYIKLDLLVKLYSDKIYRCFKRKTYVISLSCGITKYSKILLRLKRIYVVRDKEKIALFIDADNAPAAKIDIFMVLLVTKMCSLITASINN